MPSPSYEVAYALPFKRSPSMLYRFLIPFSTMPSRFFYTAFHTRYASSSCLMSLLRRTRLLLACQRVCRIVDFQVTLPPGFLTITQWLVGDVSPLMTPSQGNRQSYRNIPMMIQTMEWLLSSVKRRDRRRYVL